MNDHNTTEFAGLKWTKKRSRKKLSKKKTSSETEEDEIKRLIGSYQNIEASKIKTFKEFPLSRKTSKALKLSGYVKPTEIQRESIGLALRGLDILGAAKTGSGKSLAFLIPVIEILYTKLWSKADGLGALIITPTRELAYQIFETLRKIGASHDFSAGLVIGGKDLKFERKRMDQVNIMICTPGRLLQHMDENPVFDCSQLQVLVLDEADRCLDMGFESTMNSIIANLPPERQTLLFSATQTRSVKDLARLSLKSPVYVSVHENSEFSTPETLHQSYVVSPQESKMDLLWSFLKHHKRSKILVFLSSCKQVRFARLLFRRLKPGISLIALYGSLHQPKRMKVYDEFCKKTAVVMFATDIAARGLDFPEVDWVIQLDCPEDATTYIHRVGRTARFNKNGEALMVLLPSEEKGMIEELKKKKIPIEKIELNPSRQMSVRRKFDALLARDEELKKCAQRAFKAYLKFVFLMKNKNVFDVTQIDLPTFARSLGLADAPRVRFLQSKMAGSGKSKSVDQSGDESPFEDATTTVETDITKSNSDGAFNFSIGDGEETTEPDAMFSGRKEPTLEADENSLILVPNEVTSSKGERKQKTKGRLAKRLLKKNISWSKHINFDEEGTVVQDPSRERQSELAKSYELEDSSGIDVERAKEILKLEDKYDRELFKGRIREKHREKRLKEKLLKRKTNAEDEDVEATIGGGEEDTETDAESVGSAVEGLPDPDTVYGMKESDEEDEEFSAHQLLANFRPKLKRAREISNEPSPSRNQGYHKTKAGKASKKSKLNTETLDKEFMEELALKLLQH